MTLRDLPPVRALAEKQAREFLNALSGPAVTWETMPDTPESRRIKERHVETHLRLLTDLSRPDSRDAVARLVAAKMGLVCGATAPDFARFVCGEHCCDGVRGRMVPCSRPIWSMMGADETQMVTFADCPDPDEWDGDERRHVPGISAITDPAEALARVALAVLA